MPKQVENRVVEMEFKNKDFEKAIEVTLDSLDKLNKKLDDLNNVNIKGFDDLSKAANGVNFNRLADSIDYIAGRFTLVGVAAQKIKGQIVDELGQAVTAIGNSFGRIIDITISKGKSRSQNLAQAKFQLEALGVEWDKISQDMDYAVSGTAYGIDEAARAASQFVASGVKLGDDMKASLRGISGVAAMTGRSYTEIAQIFTTVAGTGRAMNGELNRIAERGLNAKKALADFINKTDYFGNGLKVTQEEIFEFAKKGEISFDLFSKAMDDAFGEHATKANDLFTGALANTQAALGRVGERFATPIYEELRQILVATIPVINDFKKSITPVVDATSELFGNLRKLAVELLGNYGENFELFGKTVNIKESVQTIINKVADLIDGINDAFADKNGVGSIIGRTLRNILENVGGILMAIKDAFVEVFGTPTANDIKTVFQAIEKFTEAVRISDQELTNLKNTLKLITSPLKLIYDTVVAITDIFIKPALGMLANFISELFGLTGQAGDAVSDMMSKFDPAVDIYRAFIKIRLALDPVINGVYDLGEAIRKGFVDLTGIHNMDELFTSLSELVVNLHLEDIFYGIAGAIGFAFDSLVNFRDTFEGFSGFKEYVKALADQSAVLGWFKEKIEGIKTTLSAIKNGDLTISQALGLDQLAQRFPVIQKIIDKFKEHYKSIGEAIKNPKDAIDGSPFVSGLINSLQNAIKDLKWSDIFGAIGAGFYAYWVKEVVKIKQKVAGSIASFTDSFALLVRGISPSLQKLQKETQAEKLLKIAAAIGLIALSIIALGSWDQEKVNAGIKAIIFITAALTVLCAVLAKLTSTTKKTEKMFYQESKSGFAPNLVGIGGRINGQKSGLIGQVLTPIIERFKGGKEAIQETIHDLSGFPSLLLSLGASVALIVGSLAKLIKSFGMGTHSRWEKKLKAATMALAFIMAEFIGSVIIINMQIKDFDEKQIDALNAVAKLVLAFGVCMKLIANSLLMFAMINPDKMWSNVIPAAAMLLIVVGVLTFIVVELSKYIDKTENGQKHLLAAGGAMMMLAGVIMMITIPIIAIATAAAAGANVWSAVGVILIMIGVMAAIVAGLALLYDSLNYDALAGMLGGAGAMMMIAAAINMLLIPIAAITGLIAAGQGSNLHDALVVLGMIALVMTALISVFAIVGGMGAGAVGMLAGAGAMIMMALALNMLLAPLAAIVALAKGGMLATAGIALAAVLGIFVVAGLLSGIPIVTAGLYALAAAILAFGKSVMYIGTGVFMAANGILALVKALFLLQLIDPAVIVSRIVTLGAAIITGLCMGLVQGMPMIKQAFVALVAAGCGALMACTGVVAETLIVMLKDVIVAIDNHAQELGFHLGHAIADIILYALTGVAGSIFDILERAFGGEGKFSSFLMENLLPKKDAQVKGEEGISDWFKSIFGGQKAEEAAEDSGNELGEKATDAVTDGVTSKESQDKITNGFTDTLQSSFLTVGNNISADQNIPNGMSAMGDNSLAAWTEKMGFDQMVDFGHQIPDGLSMGIGQNAWKVDESLKKMAGGSIDTTQKQYKVNSPSKVFAGIGSYLMDGLAVGIESNDSPNKALESEASGILSIFSTLDSAISNSIKNTAMDELASSIAAIGNAALGADMNPVITPVLDLSNVNEGFNSMNSMFAAGRSVSLAGEASYLQDEGRNLTMSIQNDNNSRIATGFGTLGTKLDKLGDAMMNKELVLDTGEVVGGLAAPMDRALGVRAIRAQRGGRR